VDNASALRRQLLAELRRLRPAHVVTQKQVADALDWSPSKVTRIENGSVSLSVTDLRALLAYYGVTDSGVVNGLVDLARRSRRARSPFAAFGDVFSPDALRFFDYEHSATWIGSIELLVVPGLLQTEHYARTVMGVHGVGAERVERFVSSRRVRQAVLDRPDPPTLSFILDESVLLRAIGGRAVMRAQLEHLLESAARPNVEIRISRWRWASTSACAVRSCCCASPVRRIRTWSTSSSAAATPSSRTSWRSSRTTGACSPSSRSALRHRMTSLRT